LNCFAEKEKKKPGALTAWLFLFSNHAIWNPFRNLAQGEIKFSSVMP